MHSRGGTAVASAVVTSEAATLVAGVTSEVAALVEATGAVAALAEATGAAVALVGVTGAAAALVEITGAVVAGEAEDLAGVVHAGGMAAWAIGVPIGADLDGAMVAGATDGPTDGSDIGATTAAIAFARFGRGGAGRKRG